MNRSLRLAVVVPACCALAVSTCLVPAARAQPGQFNAPWQRLPVGDGAGPQRYVEAPRDAFQLIGEIAYAPNDTMEWSILRAPAWIRLNRPEAGAIAMLTAAQLSGLARGLDAPLHLVFGRWNVESAQMAIEVLRVQRGVDTAGRPVVQVLRAPFTPHHGQRWAAARTYLSAAEAQDGSLPGRNPFAAFAAPDRTDPVFYRVSAAAAEVAIGHAMLHYHAVFGVLAVVSVRPSVTQTSGGNWFRRTVTTTVSGTAEVQWRVAAPFEVQPWAPRAAICVVPTPCLDAVCSRRRACPAPELVASSRVGFDDWSGGSLPQTPQLLYRWSTTQSSWSVLALAIFTGLAVAAGVGGVLGGAAAFDAADLAAGAYALGNTVLGSGGSLMQPQQDWFGPTGDGVLTPPTTDSPQLAAMRDAARDRTLSEPDSGAQLDAVRAGYASTAPTVNAIAPGSAAQPLPDAFRNYLRCQRQGWSGEALASCAAPDLRGDLTAP